MINGKPMSDKWLSLTLGKIGVGAPYNASKNSLPKTQMFTIEPPAQE